jgi:hypothetical protein
MSKPGTIKKVEKILKLDFLIGHYDSAKIVFRFTDFRQMAIDPYKLKKARLKSILGPVPVISPY